MVVSSIWWATMRFQSTPPREGGDRKDKRPLRVFIGISIHAPREGGDGANGGRSKWTLYFNPRPPRGGRRLPLDRRHLLRHISIHAPREGGDFRCT